MKNKSIWLEDIEKHSNKPLNKNIDIDILIIGGGITGLSIAYHLKDIKKNICLVEKDKIGCGVTSKTTAKLTYLQETIYQQINNFEKAKLYYEAQKEAIKIVEKIINLENIDCDYQKVDSILFTNENKNKVKREKEILEKFGETIKEITKLPNNSEILYGIIASNTAVFHPLKYLNGLKKIIEENIPIYESTKIYDIKKEDGYYLCKANNHIIKAKQIVIATHYPFFLFPFMMPLKCHLEKSYIAAFKDKNYPFSAINSDSDKVSIRYHENYQIYLNGSHNLAFKNNEKDQFEKLKNKLHSNPDYIWSNKDIITSDFIPYIGKIDSNLYLSTGYNTWGMTNASIAGVIISDMIQEKENKYQELFNPKREINLLKIKNYPVNIFSNIKSFFGTKLVKNKSWYSNNIIFTTLNEKKVAIYIDSSGKKHIVYQKCPHLKCTLIFNEEEKTWDCPCHGSRFDIDGKCIEGPSNYDIKYKN